MRCVIFDLDGTLADTSGDLLAAANAALTQMGHGPQLVPGPDDVIAFRGGRAMLRAAADRMALSDPEPMVDAGFPLLLDAYDQAIDTYTVLYPRVMDAVERLKGNGFAVGICTNKPEALAEKLLSRLGVRTAFGALVGADTLPVRKPDPEPLFETIRRCGGDPAAACLIGDTVTDRETARAAGVPSVLVTFGPLGETVADLGPEALLPHYDALDAVVAELLPTMPA